MTEERGRGEEEVRKEKEWESDSISRTNCITTRRTVLLAWWRGQENRRLQESESLWLYFLCKLYHSARWRGQRRPVRMREHLTRPVENERVEVLANGRRAAAWGEGREREMSDGAGGGGGVDSPGRKLRHDSNIQIWTSKTTVAVKLYRFRYNCLAFIIHVDIHINRQTFAYHTSNKD